MSTTESDRGPPFHRATLAGSALAGIVSIHLLTLLVGSIRPFPDGLLLEGAVLISLAVVFSRLERSAYATGLVVLPYAGLAVGALTATVTVGLLMTAIGAGMIAALLLYGVHRYELVRLGLVEGSP